MPSAKVDTRLSGYDKAFVTPCGRTTFVTPDSIGGPCMLHWTAIDTRLRGYDKAYVTAD
jgi:hypothetical protein